MAKCINLQVQVVTLQAEHEQSSIRVTDLSGELTEKLAELKGTEEARVVAFAKVATLEDSIRVLKSECATDAEMAALRETWFDEQIDGLERDISSLSD